MLHGVSPLGAGYFAALRSLAWTLAALCSAGLRGRWVGLVLCLGPLVITCSIAGRAAVVVNGSLTWLGVFMALHGVGIGICFAHLSSWPISAARRGEEHFTASSIATVRSLGQAFGAATAGLVANAAGLAQGVSAVTVASVATWVYGLGTLVPVVLTVLALRLLWLPGMTSLTSHHGGGRRPQLTPRQKKRLVELIEAGPLVVGCETACWSSVLIRVLIWREFGVLYNCQYVCTFTF